MNQPLDVKSNRLVVSMPHTLPTSVQSIMTHRGMLSYCENKQFSVFSFVSQQFLVKTGSNILNILPYAFKKDRIRHFKKYTCPQCPRENDPYGYLQRPQSFMHFQ